MFASGYNPIRAEIEIHYGLLEQMIHNISTHLIYPLNQFQTELKSNAIKDADGDIDVYLFMLHQYDDEIERQESLCVEARKIQFCAIFSYYESMLNLIRRYYKLKKTPQHQIGHLYESIKKEFHKKYSEELEGINPLNIDLIHKPFLYLRNFFMYGELSDVKKRKELFLFVDTSDFIKSHNNEFIEITDNQFLYESLNIVKQNLISIEKNFSDKVDESLRSLQEAQKICSEIIKLYPPEVPGLEEEFPPYCSIKVHKLILKAEEICKKVAKEGNPDAQMLLANIYLTLYEIPQKKKCLYWLKEAEKNGCKSAKAMLKELLYGK